MLDLFRFILVRQPEDPWFDGGCGRKGLATGPLRRLHCL